MSDEDTLSDFEGVSFVDIEAIEADAACSAAQSTEEASPSKRSRLSSPSEDDYFSDDLFAEFSSSGEDELECDEEYQDPCSLPSVSALSPEQREAYRCILSQRRPFVLVGKPGTGKSTVMKLIIDNEKKKKPLANDMSRYIVAGTSSLSAINLDEGGMTLHSFLAITPKDRNFEQSVAVMKKRYPTLFTWQTVLIITEAFMMECSLLYYLDEVLRKVAKDRKSKHADKPFGGIWMVMDGDPLQIPPVKKGRGVAPYMFQDIDAITSEPILEFNSLWLSAFPKTDNPKDKCVFILTQNMRQREDTEFAEAVEHLALGTICESGPKYQALRSLLLNCSTEHEMATRIYPRNGEVDMYNNQRLGQLDGESFEFPPICCEKLKKFQRDALSSVTLKVGCKVRCTQNLTGVSNGHVGVVTRIESKEQNSKVYVKFAHLPTDDIPVGYVDVPAYKHSKQQMAYFAKRKLTPPPVPRHIPLRVAYAMTIHSVQGLTLPEGVVVDLERSFHPAMAVVAISRVCSRDRIAIKNLSFQRPLGKTPSAMFYDYYT